MRNRAKCKLCQKIVESLLPEDYQQCECGEIGIDGGNIKFKVFYKNVENFLRIDDNGNEVIVKEAPPSGIQDVIAPTKEELLKILDEVISSDYEGKPDYYMHQRSPTNYDIYALLLLFKSLFRSS